MNNIEILIIRACKSKNAELRLQSIYRRFYNSDVSYTKECFITKLADIQDTYRLMPLTRLLSNILDYTRYQEMENNITRNPLAVRDAMYSALISTIRLASVDKFEGSGFIKPCRFRRLDDV